LLVDRHIPYRVIPDWKLTPAGLAGFKTIYLPMLNASMTPRRRRCWLGFEKVATWY